MRLVKLLKRSRQPEMIGKLRTLMLVGQAVSETTGIYALIIAILIDFCYLRNFLKKEANDDTFSCR